MRHDSIGLFWQDLATTGGRSSVAREMPPIPDTGWVPPQYFPDLSGEPCICVDVETYDPNMDLKGPGWATNDGRIVGVAIGVPSGGRWYFPISHEVETEYNMNKAQVFAWLSHTLSNPKQDKVGANILYDYGWLKAEGINIQGELMDVQYAESLLEETGLVNLDYLGEKYCRVGKETDILYDWCAQFYGGTPGQKQRTNIYRAPPRLVGPYAMGDVDLPLHVIKHQFPLLQKMGLLHLFSMECRLMKLCYEMRKTGVRVDLDKANALSETLAAKAKEVQARLDHIAGMSVKQTEAASIAKAFDKLGLSYGRTAKNNSPSFTKTFLENHDHLIAQTIVELRKIEKLKGTFVDSYILEGNVGGRIYGQFHALRSDRSGTRSGRFSSSTPNLQNIPSRDKELAPLIRGLFVPDYCHRYWRKYDYSQIEYRFLVHFAQGPGSDAARQQFRDNPDTDYHDFVLDMVAPFTGWQLSNEKDRSHYRKPLKTINFGLIYGMMQKKLAATLGLTAEQADTLFKGYHKAIPYVAKTMEAVEASAMRDGEVRTILNRRSPFELFEPDRRGERMPALPYAQAVAAYGPRVRRAMLHKALNRKLQGSAADMMKTAMLTAYEAGIFDRIGIPKLTVHDELDFSDPGGVDDGFRELQNVLENCMPLSVPIKADCDIGPDWGHVESYTTWSERNRNCAYA